MNGTTTNGRGSRDPEIVKAGPARVMRRAQKLATEEIGPIAAWPRSFGPRKFPGLQELAGPPIATKTTTATTAFAGEAYSRTEIVPPHQAIQPELGCRSARELEELLAIIAEGLELPADPDEARLELGARAAAYAVVEAQEPLEGSRLAFRLVHFPPEGTRPTIRAHVRRLDLAVALAEALAAREEDDDAEAGREAPPLLDGWRLFCAPDLAEVVAGIGRRRGYLRATRGGEIVLVDELPEAVLADRWILARRRRGVRQ